MFGIVEMLLQLQRNSCCTLLFSWLSDNAGKSQHLFLPSTLTSKHSEYLLFCVLALVKYLVVSVLLGPMQAEQQLLELNSLRKINNSGLIFNLD